MQGLRRAAIHFALIALILRALQPVGWMPNPQGFGASPLVICSMGLAQPQSHDPGKPNQAPDDSHSNDVCPFAAAAHVMAPVPVALSLQPGLEVAAALPPIHAIAAFVSATRAPGSPRAPPAPSEKSI